MLRRAFFAGVISVACFLAGCFFIRSSQVAYPPPSATCVIEGYVTLHAGGEPVVAATVRALPISLNTAGTVSAPVATPTEYRAISRYVPSPGGSFSGTLSTVTDEEGYFRLFVPQGVYALEVRKEGYATSRVEGLKIVDAARVNIVQKPIANPGGSLEPPRVTVLGITEGMTISGPIPVIVEAESENGIKWIAASVGGPPTILAPYFLEQELPFYLGPVFSQTSRAAFTLDPVRFGVVGRTTFEVIVYDGNNNRLHLILGVYVVREGLAPGPGEVQPPRVADSQGTVCASVTFSKALDLYRLSGEPALQVCAAPPGTNLVGIAVWRSSLDEPNITGYRVYRKIGNETEFRLIGTVGVARPSEPWEEEVYQYVDTSPELKVGVPVTYRVTAYRGELESDYLEGTTTPLPPWEVELLEPAHGATGVSLTPTFRWRAKPAWPGCEYEYVLLVIEAGKPLLPPARAWWIRDATELTVSEEKALAPNTTYEWLFLRAWMADDLERPTASSFAAITPWKWGTSEGWRWWELIPSPRAQFTTGGG